MIDTQVTRADASAGAQDDDGTAYPSLAQQRADALVQVLTEPSAGAHVDAEVVMHITEDGNHLADGTPLSDRAVTEMLPEAFVSLLMYDSARQPIDASPRRRSPTRRQRRVIDQHHVECAHTGCHARTFLQYDHIKPYPAGGPTIIDNVQRLRGPHNRAKSASLKPQRVQRATSLTSNEL